MEKIFLARRFNSSPVRELKSKKGLGQLFVSLALSGRLTSKGTLRAAVPAVLGALPTLVVTAAALIVRGSFESPWSVRARQPKLGNFQLSQRCSVSTLAALCKQGNEENGPNPDFRPEFGSLSGSENCCFMQVGVPLVKDLDPRHAASPRIFYIRTCPFSRTTCPSTSITASLKIASIWLGARTFPPMA